MWLAITNWSVVSAIHDTLSATYSSSSSSRKKETEAHLDIHRQHQWIYCQCRNAVKVEPQSLTAVQTVFDGDNVLVRSPSPRRLQGLSDCRLTEVFADLRLTAAHLTNTTTTVRVTVGRRKYSQVSAWQRHIWQTQQQLSERLSVDRSIRRSPPNSGCRLMEVFADRHLTAAHLTNTTTVSA